MEPNQRREGRVLRITIGNKNEWSDIGRKIMKFIAFKWHDFFFHKINQFYNVDNLESLKTYYIQNFNYIVWFTTHSLRIYKNLSVLILVCVIIHFKPIVHLLMNNLPSLFERKMSVDQIAQNYKLPYSQVLNYCGRWQKKNLIKKY